MAEGTDCGAIHRDAAVTPMSENNRTQVLANLADAVVHGSFESVFTNCRNFVAGYPEKSQCPLLTRWLSDCSADSRPDKTQVTGTWHYLLPFVITRMS
jgi:hypothetical protein